jgi:hypothetical protein
MPGLTRRSPVSDEGGRSKAERLRAASCVVLAFGAGQAAGALYQCDRIENSHQASSE